jgi:hypothetical protein
MKTLEIYSHVRALFDLENPDLKPLSEKWPTVIKKKVGFLTYFSYIYM